MHRHEDPHAGREGVERDSRQWSLPVPVPDGVRGQHRGGRLCGGLVRAGGGREVGEVGVDCGEVHESEDEGRSGVEVLR